MDRKTDRTGRTCGTVFLKVGCLLAVLALAACRSGPPPSQQAQRTATTLLDQQLLETIEAERRLDAAAADPDAEEREIQRLFQDVARQYEGITIRNPRHLESRLLYGKFLSRYGDSEGARLQFLEAARLDPDVAVIHQQLSTYYAEADDPTRALAYALNAVRLEPETAAYQFQLGQVLAAFKEQLAKVEALSREQIDADLLAAFQTARQLQPDSLNLQFRYGEAFYDVDQPDWETALAHWQSLAQNPRLSPIQADAVRVHMARCLSELNRPAEARALLQQVQSSTLHPQPTPPPDPAP